VEVAVKFSAKKTKAAFAQRELKCPLCHGVSHTFLNRVTDGRVRFQCKACDAKHVYDYSLNRVDHPYAVFTDEAWKKAYAARNREVTK
jgi:hypothetical protein